MTMESDKSVQLKKACNNPSEMWKLLAAAGKLIADEKPIDKSWALHIGRALQAASREYKADNADKAEKTLIQMLRVKRMAGRPAKVTIQEINELRAQPGMPQTCEFDVIDEKTGEVIVPGENPKSLKIKDVAKKLKVTIKTIEAKTAAHRDAEKSWQKEYVDPKDWARAKKSLVDSGTAEPTNEEILAQLVTPATR